MKHFSHPYLDLSRMELLRKIRLKPRGKAEGTFSGPHASHTRGTAVEFADYREYVPGDDIRLLDWKVAARTDRHYIRIYEAERNLLSTVALDTSASMQFRGVTQTTPSKHEFGCQLAAALAYLVVREGDEAGLALMGEGLHQHMPPRTGFSHLMALLQELVDAPQGGTTRLGESLEAVFRRNTRRGVLIVISDLLDPEPERFWSSIDMFRRSHFDVMLFHVLHPEELELPDVPNARFVSTEGEPLRFDAEPDLVRLHYRERMQTFLRTQEAGAVTRGCDWFLARTDDDPINFLRRTFLAMEGR